MTVMTCRFDNFYPRPPRGGRHAVVFIESQVDGISIHALREEGDLRLLYCPAATGISIHALREEGDTRSSTV